MVAAAKKVVILSPQTAQIVQTANSWSPMKQKEKMLHLR